MISRSLCKVGIHDILILTTSSQRGAGLPAALASVRLALRNKVLSTPMVAEVDTSAIMGVDTVGVALALCRRRAGRQILITGLPQDLGTGNLGCGGLDRPSAMGIVRHQILPSRRSMATNGELMCRLHVTRVHNQTKNCRACCLAFDDVRRGRGDGGVRRGRANEDAIGFPAPVVFRWKVIFRGTGVHAA
jgi:hypothetical protein